LRTHPAEENASQDDKPPIRKEDFENLPENFKEIKELKNKRKARSF